jgi:hypothetical protein
MSALDFAPFLPLWLIIVIALVGSALSYLSFKTSKSATLFRLLAVVFLLIGLLNPTFQHQETQALSDIALVITDQSTSQDLEKRKVQSEQAVAFFKQQQKLHRDLELRFITLAQASDEDVYGTQLIPTLRQAISGIDPKRFAGSILITDGQIHDADQFENLPGPFHVLLSGEKNTIDRRIEILEAPQYGLIGQGLHLRVRVLDNGQTNPNAPVRLIFPDGTEELLEAQEDGTQDIFFEMEYAGQDVFEVETDPLENEISLQNNRAALVLNGVRDRLRVLLVSGQPHQGQRTWRNILRSDASVDLVHFTILRPSEKDDYTPLSELSLIAFPVHELFEEKLTEFDLIIFDRYYKHNVLNDGYFNNIVDYVKNGGALMISSGPDFTGSRSLATTPLNSILPAKPTGRILEDQPYRLRLSETGKKHPITTRLNSDEKDWGRWIRLIEATDISGDVLLENKQGQPILITEHLDEGRIAMLLSDHFWLWARGYDGGGPHSEMVRNLIHWLMKEPDLEEERLSLKQISPTQVEVTRQSLDHDEDQVTITQPDGETQTITLKDKGKGLRTATFEAQQKGLYRADMKTLSSLINIGKPNPKEMMDPRSSNKPLEPMVQSLSGSINWIGDGIPEIKTISPASEPSGSGWIGLKHNKATALTGVTTLSLLPNWTMFLLVAGCLFAAWWRESH